MTDIPYIDNFFNWIERKAQSRFFIYILIVVILFLTCPYKMPGTFSKTWDTVVLKSQDLTNSLTDLDPKGNAAKKVFRLTVPVLMRVFNVSPLGIEIIQY